MGLMRRVESRVENAVGAGKDDARGAKPRRDRSTRESKPYVQPAELARKLAKEMDSHKVARSSRVSASNKYSVYLCPLDAEHLRPREDDIVHGLERHLREHAHSKHYDLPGDISVRLIVDEDLRLGQFGILAELIFADALAATPAAAPIAPAQVPGASVRADPRRTCRTRPSAPVPTGSAAVGGETRVIQPEEAARMGLAHQALVLKSGNRVREFNKGRVIVGRAKDADFRIDDPNVSRRHAAIYWENGRVMVEDLDSTNGTLVNGYPVLNTPLNRSDIVYIGGHKITVETR